jgi:FAD/FMN-containing dehydrogenase
VPDLDAAVATVSFLRATVGALEAAEYVVRAGLELVTERFGLADPFPRPYPTYLLVEAAGTRDPMDELTAAVSAAGTVLDAAVASSAVRREELWRLRDLHTEAVAAVGRPRKYDVTVPVRDVAAFIAAATEVVAARSPAASVHHWGHLGDGNVHLNVLGLDAHAPGPALDDLDGAILGLVARFEGSISAEHGRPPSSRPSAPSSTRSTRSGS